MTNITIGPYIDKGAYADLYRGTDELGREVAIKFIRQSAGDANFAINQAKALARAQHQNIVDVYTIEELPDPETGNSVKAIIMEFLPGQTLSQVLQGPTLRVDEIKSIGEDILNAIEHIHSRGLAHGDLHTDNIIIEKFHAKIFDILYFDSLAILSSKAVVKKQSDLAALKVILRSLLTYSELEVGTDAEFNAELSKESNLSDIRNAFLKVIDIKKEEQLPKLFEQAFQWIVDPSFVSGEAYAQALSKETKTQVILPLLKKMVADSITQRHHVDYLAFISSRLTADQFTSIISDLSEKLNKETPKGNWGPHMFMLKAFCPMGWQLLPAIPKLRLESLITEDILSGRYDIFGTMRKSGILGTWGSYFYLYFKDLEQLATNLITLLCQGWYTQNYVGKYFMDVLPDIATKTNKRAEFIKAITVAYENDARLIKNNISKLPKGWEAEITCPF